MRTQQNKTANRLIKYNKPTEGLGIEFRVFELDTRKFLYQSGIFNSLDQAKISARKYLLASK
jgi:hypothetical protein